MSPAAELPVAVAPGDSSSVGLAPPKTPVSVPDADARPDEEALSKLELEAVGVLLMRVDGDEVVELVTSADEVNDVDKESAVFEAVASLKAPKKAKDSVPEAAVDVRVPELVVVVKLDVGEITVELAPVSEEGLTVRRCASEMGVGDCCGEVVKYEEDVVGVGLCGKGVDRSDNGI